MKISWKLELLYTLMRVIGILIAIIGIFAAAFRGTLLWFLLGIGLFFAGVYLEDRLYRCPHCGHYLRERNWKGMPTSHLFRNCPGCGWQVHIEE